MKKFTIEIDNKYSEELLEEILTNILSSDPIFSDSIITKITKDNKCKYDDCDYENCPWYIYGKLYEKRDKEEYVPYYPPMKFPSVPESPWKITFTCREVGL
jgi:hypothetical protein